MQGPYNPYESPQHQAYAAPAEHAPPYAPLGWKTPATAAGIIAGLVLGLVIGVLPMALGNGPEKRILLTASILLISLVATIVGIATTIVFLVWTYQAATNARAFRQQELEFTPGWAVGWWFIPIACLWLPYRALKETWLASDPETVGGDGRAWLEKTKVPSLFPLWWGTYWGYFVVSVGIGVAQAIKNLEAPDQAQVGGGPGALAAQIIIITSAVALVSIMKQLDRRQEECAEKLQASFRR